MDYYALNLAVLRQKEPDLANRLEKVSPNPHLDIERLKELPSPILPPYLTEATLNTLVVLGFGIGKHIKELLQIIPAKTFVLVIDPDINSFKSILQHLDLRDIFLSGGARVGFCIDEDPSRAVRFRLDNYYKVNTVSKIWIAEYNLSVQSNPQYYEKIKKYLKEAGVIALQNLATVTQHAKDWQDYLMTNLVKVIKTPGIISLFDRFKGTPAIIVSAGPSLDKNVDDLKAAVGHALILSVDTALRTLLNHGILPNIVVSIDVTEKNYDLYLKDLSVDKIYLLCGPIAPTVILNKFAPRIFVSSFGYPLYLWIEQFIGSKGQIAVGGSVATATFDVARKVGANPVVFIGQDLSYPDDRIYTKDVPQHWQNEVKEILNKIPMCWVDDIYGNKVKTSVSMWTWIQWFEYQIQTTPDIQFIDATEGGARIPGTTIMTLKEVINKYCQRPVIVKERFVEAEKFHTIPSVERLIKGLEILSIEWARAGRNALVGEKETEEFIEIVGKEGMSKRARMRLKEVGICFNRLIEHKGLLRLGEWHFEKILDELENSKSVNDPMIRINCYLKFFRKVNEYCQSSTEQFKEAVLQLNAL